MFCNHIFIQGEKKFVRGTGTDYKGAGFEYKISCRDCGLEYKQYLAYIAETAAISSMEEGGTRIINDHVHYFDKSGKCQVKILNEISCPKRI